MAPTTISTTDSVVTTSETPVSEAPPSGVVAAASVPAGPDRSYHSGSVRPSTPPTAPEFALALKEACIALDQIQRAFTYCASQIEAGNIVLTPATLRTLGRLYLGSLSANLIGLAEDTGATVDLLGLHQGLSNAQLASVLAGALADAKATDTDTGAR